MISRNSAIGLLVFLPALPHLHATRNKGRSTIWEYQRGQKDLSAYEVFTCRTLYSQFFNCNYRIIVWHSTLQWLSLDIQQISLFHLLALKFDNQYRIFLRLWMF